MSVSGLPIEPRPVATGTHFAGRYRIEGLLGRGGSGSVYRAWDLAQGRPVALKVLAADVLAHDAALARFRREADLAQRLSHPNVVRIFDFGRTADGTAYMVLELVRGQTLATLLRTSGPLPVERVVRIGAQVLKGLMEAHALGIVHRDIKPSNLQVCDFPGEPDFLKILDFGIAKTPQFAGDTTGMTRDGHVLGTPSYMAPEQILGWPIGPAADLYAVGLVLAEMIAGRPVYAGAPSIHVMMAQASAAPVPLPDEVLASPLAPVVQRATVKEPARRYAAGSEMLSDLVGCSRGAGAPVSGFVLPQPPTADAGAALPAARPGALAGAFPPARGGAPVAVPPLRPAKVRLQRFVLSAAGLATMIGLGGGAFVLGRRHATVVGVPGPPIIVSGGAPSASAPVASAAADPGAPSAGPAAEPTAPSAAPPSEARVRAAPGATAGTAAVPTTYNTPAQPAPRAAATPTPASASNLPMCLDGDTRNPVEAATPAAAQACNTFGPPYGPGVAYVTFDPSTGAAVSADIVIMTPSAGARVHNPGVEACMRAALMKVRIKPCGWGTSVQGNASFNLPPR